MELQSKRTQSRSSSWKQTHPGELLKSGKSQLKRTQLGLSGTALLTLVNEGEMYLNLGCVGEIPMTSFLSDRTG